MHYEDVGFHIAIFKGFIGVSKIFPYTGANANKWFYTKIPSESSSLNKEFAALKIATDGSTWSALERDKKVLNFPNIVYSEPLEKYEFIGDIWYLVTDNAIIALMVNKEGELSKKMIRNYTVANGISSFQRAMAIDSNLIIYAKQIFVYQFQGFTFQPKPSFGPLKDIEDIMITRESGLRLFKAKGTKNKFKLFSTMPSSDWNPYIEGVSRKNLLSEEGYTNITFIDAKYGNVVVMVNTGKHYKYFIVAECHAGERLGPEPGVRRDLQLLEDQLHRCYRDQPLPVHLETEPSGPDRHSEALQLQGDAEQLIADPEVGR